MFGVPFTTHGAFNRNIGFFLQPGKGMSSPSSEGEPQAVFQMNTFPLEETYEETYIDSLGNSRNKISPIYATDYYAEFGISKSSYIIIPESRELLELAVVYKLASLPEAEIPIAGDDLSDVERVTLKRNWTWKSARKELDVVSVRHSLETLKNPVSGDTLEDYKGYLLRSTYDSFYGTISMRGIRPFYRQEITPMLPTYWSFSQSPGLVLRKTPWGNLIEGKDSISVNGSYNETFKVLPKRAVGVIA